MTPLYLLSFLLASVSVLCLYSVDERRVTVKCHGVQHSCLMDPFTTNTVGLLRKFIHLSASDEELSCEEDGVVTLRRCSGYSEADSIRCIAYCYALQSASFALIAHSKSSNYIFYSSDGRDILAYCDVPGKIPPPDHLTHFNQVETLTMNPVFRHVVPSPFEYQCAHAADACRQYGHLVLNYQCRGQLEELN